MLPTATEHQLTVLKNVFGYDTFRPRQGDIIQRVLDGLDSLVIMPTGGGKSLCYQLPALIRPGVGLVVSPLISLMQDQVEALKQLGVRAAFLNSSLTRSAQRAVVKDLKAGALDLLYVAPERLLTDGFLTLLDTCPVALLAIDEAHCISQWGHDFRPEYTQLTRVRERLKGIPCLAVTATADEPTRREIVRQLHLPEDGVFVTGFDRPNICYQVVLKQNPRQQLLRFITSEHEGEAGIVYCFTRKKVEDLSAWLSQQGLEALPYHAGLPARERQTNQDRFLQEEGLLVVATVAFGMGIDKPNVRFVAHMDVPKSPESYYQETGRAGRDGLPSNAWMAYSMADVVLLRKILESSEAQSSHKWVEQHKLSAIVGFCETVACRRQVLLNYFGDDHTGNCSNCDNCLNPVETWDGTVAAQKVFSCVARTGQRFGAGHLIDVLLGRDTTKIKRFRHDQLSTYGIGIELTATEWRSVIRQLVAANLLSVDVDGYGGIRLTEACGPILKGVQDVQFRKDPRPTKKKKAKKTATEAVLPATPDARRLFEALRNCRLELARQQGVPPYVIFPDSTLIALVQHRPTNHDDFAQMPGVGAVKLERYADVFLDVLIHFD